MYMFIYADFYFISIKNQAKAAWFACSRKLKKNLLFVEGTQ